MLMIEVKIIGHNKLRSMFGNALCPLLRGDATN